MARPRLAPAMNLTCSVCHQTFGRQEHLTRHFRIHTHEKPYGCSFCEKRFSRLDALTRHKASHEQQAEVSHGPVSSRACKQCALDRVRCSRNSPCKRCSDRDLPCCYPAGANATSRSNISERRDLHSNVIENGDPGSVPTIARTDPSSSTIETPAGLPGMSNAMTVPSAHALSNLAGGADIWNEPFDGFTDICNVDLPSLGSLGINWISPGYQYGMDWDMIPNNGAASYQEHSSNQQVLHDTIISPHLPFDRGEQQAPQATPSSITAESCDIVQTTLTPRSTGREYYVDGDGSRAPFGGRYHSRDSRQALHARSSEAETGGISRASTSSYLCSVEAYDNMCQKLMSEFQPQGSVTDMTQNPSHAQIELFVQRYFDRFSPIFPFLSRAAFMKDVSQDWLLLLAVAAIGARYVPASQSSYNILSQKLHVAFDCRRRNCLLGSKGMEEQDLYVQDGCARTSNPVDLNTLRAGILHLVCLLQSGKRSGLNRALDLRHYLVNICNSLRLLDRTRNDENNVSLGQYTDPETWSENEGRIRTGMVLWILDSTTMYEFGFRPLMSLDDVKVRLPSNEDIYRDEVPGQQANKIPSSTTLVEALEILYVEKRLPAGLSEFSVGILIHAIYRHTKDMLTASRLKSWIPTATAEQRNTAQSNLVHSDWLPSTQIASKWRNSACDSLDILHWHANSKVAKSSGFEHHTILHLHLARIIILTPTDCIQTLSETVSRVSPTGLEPDDRDCLASARNELVQWAVRDRYKARLAVIHCAALYWHVRRYSCNSVQEPYAIYIATLVLWAFCIAMQLPQVAEAIPNDSEITPDPTFCHLDRPLDDELVQLFVRVGHRMCPNISKVGNILDHQAAPKILQEGSNLLMAGSRPLTNTIDALSQFTWETEEFYARSLSRILEAMTYSDSSGVIHNGLMFPWGLIAAEG